jgi:NitT/TauT family transport system permease protein/taurine transport system permease protein
MRISPATVRRLILVLILALWELVPRTGLIPELFLPSLSKTLTVLLQNFDEYGEALLVTLYEVALAMLIACGGGILVGALVGGLAVLRNLLLPVFSSLYAVPIVILYPIFTAWFGIGSESKIAFAGVYGFFPVMLSTAAGIRTGPPTWRTTRWVRSFRASSSPSFVSTTTGSGQVPMTTRVKEG